MPLYITFVFCALFQGENLFFIYLRRAAAKKSLFAEVAETAEESFASPPGHITAFYVPEACCCGAFNYIPDLYQGAFLDY